MKKKKRGAGTTKSTTTVFASVAFASFITCCTSTPHFTLGPMSRRLFSVNATSSAENGVPSDHEIPERVLMVSCLKSGVYW